MWSTARPLRSDALGKVRRHGTLIESSKFSLSFQGIEQDLARPQGPLINDRLHPDAFRDFDKHFIEHNLINQQWSNGWHVDKFETVIVKVADARDRPVPNL